MDDQADSVYHEQWSNEVVSFSSQYGSEFSISYTVSNITGEPTTYPSYGDYTQCCVLRTYGTWWKIAPFNEGFPPYQKTPEDFISEDFIELSFDHKVYPVKVKVYETYNPGTVVRILCCDKSKDELKDGEPARWFELYKGKPVKEPATSRIFAPHLQKADFPTNLIRLEFNQSKSDYYTELDAVKLVGVLPKTEVYSSSNVIDFGSNVDPEEFEQNGYLNEVIREPVKESNIEKVSKGILELHLQDGVCSSLHHGISAVLDVSDNGHFDSLPEEVIQVILQHLDLKALCTLASVSHLFYKHCYDTLQYRDLNLQPYWHKVTDKTLTDFIFRCQHLNRLNLSWCTMLGSGLQKFVTFCGKELTSLRLACCSFIDCDMLKVISHICCNLEDLDLSCCQKIRDLGFTSLYQLTHLQRLNLYRTLVDVYSLVVVVRSCQELKCLNLGSCIRITDFSPLVNVLAAHCKQLKSLDLWKAHHLTSDNLIDLATGCPHLEELDLGWCSSLCSHQGCFVHLAEHCKNLRKLFLTANRTVCDRDLAAIANNCKKLEQLDILGTREVTINDAQRLLEQCPNLIFLDVSFCHGLDNLAVHELRKAYPKVSIKKSFQS